MKYQLFNDCAELEATLSLSGWEKRRLDIEHDGLILFFNKIGKPDLFEDIEILGIWSCNNCIGCVGTFAELTDFLQSISDYVSFSHLYNIVFPNSFNVRTEFHQHSQLICEGGIQEVGRMCISKLEDLCAEPFPEDYTSLQRVEFWLELCSVHIARLSVHDRREYLFPSAGALLYIGFLREEIVVRPESFNDKFGQSYHWFRYAAKTSEQIWESYLLRGLEVRLYQSLITYDGDFVEELFCNLSTIYKKYISILLLKRRARLK